MPKEILVPENLVDLLVQANRVQRYSGIYKEGIIDDNTLNHTLRCIEFASNLPLPKPDKDRLTKTLLIHDLPEIITGDISVIAKLRNNELAIQQENGELKAAKTILSEDDLILFTNFNKVGQFIKGETNEPPDSTTILASVIDRIDGNAFFHNSVVIWINSENYKPEDIPPDDSLIYTFRFSKQAINRLNSIHKKSNVKLAIELINQALGNIGDLWQRVDPQRTPECIREELAKISI